MIRAQVNYENSRCVVKLHRNSRTTSAVETADYDVRNKSLRQTKQFQKVSCGALDENSGIIENSGN